MIDNEKELINRYIYEVTRRVSKEQRLEIEMELQELIEDMREGLTLEQVFAKLGDPAVFAKKYREDKNYVISPEYYDNYVWVMSIVLICVAAGLFISTVVTCIINHDKIFYEIARFFGKVIPAALSAFGSVTLIFAFMERQKIKVDLKTEKVWTPEMLNPIPDKKARISRGDCIVSMVFIVLFSCLLIFAPQLFGAYSMQNNEVINVPLFNLDKWGLILPVFLFSLAVGFVDELIKLVVGCYCRLVMVSSIVSNVIQIVSGIIVLKVMPIWNMNFGQEVMERFDAGFKFKVFWEKKLVLEGDGMLLSDLILALIVIVSIGEIGAAIYKTMRYGKEKREEEVENDRIF